MRIKFYFFILVLFLFGLGIALVYLVGKMQTMHLYIAEAIITSILVYLGVFYHKIVKPISTIGNGIELLCEQGFSSRPSRVGQYEADRTANTFSRMTEQLKDERLYTHGQNHFLDLLIRAPPMRIVTMTSDGEMSQLDPMAVKVLGVCRGRTQNKKLVNIDSPLAEELASTPEDVTSMVRLSGADIYERTHSSSIDRGFKYPFFLIERVTDGVMRVEKRAYEKVICVITHEVNNTTAGITSTLDTVEQALSIEEDMEDICDVMRVCTERCFSTGRFITRFADVMKVPELTVAAVRLNELVYMCKRFMEGMCNDRSTILRLECDPEMGQVRLDASLLRQVLVDIIKSAAESIEEFGEAADRQGRMTVRTIAPASIKIVDSGPGISREAEAKLLSPSFSARLNG